MIAPTTNAGNAGFPPPVEIANGSPIIGISLYTGAMGLDLGLERGAGVRFLLAADSSAAARATIRANRPDVRVLDDASRLTAAQARKAAGLSPSDAIDVVAGCPPCPPWSVAGKRLGIADPRGMLLPGFVDLGIELAPRAIVHENVKGLASAELGGEKGGLLRLLVYELRRNGYRVAWSVVNAADYGAPQNRERLVLVACRDADPALPEPTHSEDGSGGLPKWRTLRDAMDGLPLHPCDHVEYSPGMLRYMARLRPGQWWKHLPPGLCAEAVPHSYHKGGGGTGTLRRLSWDKPCPTVTCSPAQKMTTLGHPGEDRPLSVQECMRVQGFPDSWRIRGSTSERYAQVGNAVPAPLAEAIGRAVARTLGIKEGGRRPAERPVEISPPQRARLSRNMSKKGRGVLAWSIMLPEDRCPFATPLCSRLCYAKRDNFLLHRARHEGNYAFTQSDRFIDGMAGEIRREAARAHGGMVSVCLHAKGDFFSLPYLLKWREVIRRTASCPNLRYYVHTRAWTSGKFRAALDAMAGELPNVRINLSVDRENAREHGVPGRVGDGLVTWLAETDSDLPPEGAAVDLVFRNTEQKRLPPAESLGGFLVCPNEARLYFSRGAGKAGGKRGRIACGECRLCIDRPLAEWDKLKGSYRSGPDPIPVARDSAGHPATAAFPDMLAPGGVSPVVRGRAGAPAPSGAGAVDGQVAQAVPASGVGPGWPGGIRFIDLCSGIGGFRLAIEAAGGRCVFSSEIEPRARETYFANFGEWPSGDITKIRDEDVPDHDVLCCGFPCQSFSIAGKQLGFADATRGTVFHEIARVIAAKRPAAAFLENVPNLLKHDGGRTFGVIRKTLEGIGYAVSYAVLNASLYGVPTARRRLYVVAFRSDLGVTGFRFPEPTLEPVRLADVLLPDSETGDCVVHSGRIHVDDEKVAMATRNPALRLIGVGQVGDEKQTHQGGRIYSPQGLAVTLTSNGGGMGGKTGLYFVNVRVRRLHPTECKRVMGFPDSFVIPPSVSVEQARRLFGNSVAVPVVRRVYESIAAALAEAGWPASRAEEASDPDGIAVSTAKAPAGVVLAPTGAAGNGPPAYSVASLFSGCGGMDLGFRQAGFEVVVACEWDEDHPAIARTYEANHPGTKMVNADIRLPETKDRICEIFKDRRCDAVIGGFPCVAFSMSGRRDPGDPRGRLFEDYLDVVRRLRPAAVVMENVPGILSRRKDEQVPVVERIVEGLAGLGYHVEHRILNAADYGVPQKRRRVILVAARPGTSIRFPRPTHAEGAPPSGDILP